MTNFEQFICERKYFQGVSERTLGWYRECFQWFGRENPTQNDLKEFVIGMREAGLAIPTWNNRIRAINAYLHWQTAGIDKKCDAGCGHLKISALKEPETILPTFTPLQILEFRKLKPTSEAERSGFRGT